MPSHRKSLGGLTRTRRSYSLRTPTSLRRGSLRRTRSMPQMDIFSPRWQMGGAPIPRSPIWLSRAPIARSGSLPSLSTYSEFEDALQNAEAGLSSSMVPPPTSFSSLMEMDWGRDRNWARRDRSFSGYSSHGMEMSYLRHPAVRAHLVQERAARQRGSTRRRVMVLAMQLGGFFMVMVILFVFLVWMVIG